jgi:hypothetical protein
MLCSLIKIQINGGIFYRGSLFKILIADSFNSATVLTNGKIKRM